MHLGGAALAPRKALACDITRTSPASRLIVFLETLMLQHALAYTKPVPGV